MLDRLSGLFSAFAFSAGAGGKDISSICKEISVFDKFECFTFVELFLSYCFDGCDLCAVWCGCVDKAKELSCLKKEERELIKSFSEVFFASGIEEFCVVCRKFSEKFGLLSAQAQESSLKNQKIFVSGSVLAAAAFFIISF